jgi:hypothetical protein
VQRVLNVKGFKAAVRAGGGEFQDIKLTPSKVPPSDYSILAAITKYDPGTFKDFCDDFGYSDDPIMAQRTYFKVQEGWAAVRRLFSGKELEMLAEID